jgi:hypothetical protein
VRHVHQILHGMMDNRKLVSKEGARPERFGGRERQSFAIRH